MNKRDKSRNGSKNTIKKSIPLAALALSAVLLTAGLISIASNGASANYRQQRTVTNVPVTITVSADLASGLAVLEHRADRLPSGRYQLATDEEPVTSNEYVLMPGVNIAKDPFVRVTGKTAIPAYLFVEVVDDTDGGDDTFSFAVDSANWLEVTGRTGPNGGKVYVYAQGGSAVKLDTSNTGNGSIDVYILENNQVTVKPGLDLNRSYSGCELKFYASMAQAVSDDYSEIYRTQLAS